MAEESLIARLKKVAALAVRGVGGERDNAQRILGRLLKKYDMTEDDLRDSPTTKRYEFKYKTRWERIILFQCYSRVMSDSTIHYWQRGRGRVVIELNFFQFLELDALYNHFTVLLKKEMNLFCSAFIAKHHLTSGKEQKKEGKSKLTSEELESILHMMMAMKESGYVSPRKQLGG
ncbi:MAG TPA: hypothetical protein ENH85_03145 [Candidatus Scalindua sp.]|nr:hypothetical protein [Candidatus Scalindua sp.]